MRTGRVRREIRNKVCVRTEFKEQARTCVCGLFKTKICHEQAKRKGMGWDAMQYPLWCRLRGAQRVNYNVIKRKVQH